MIEALRGLCAALAGPITAEAAARSVGSVAADEGGLTAIRVRPSAPEFTQAMVVRRPDGMLSHVELVLAHPAELNDLVVAFGDPARPPRTMGRNPTVIFRSSQCVLVADLADDHRVTSISVRHEGN